MLQPVPHPKSGFDSAWVLGDFPRPVWLLDTRYAGATTVFDASDYGNNSTVNSAAWAVDDTGPYLDFTGTVYVSVPHAPAIDIAGDKLTMSGWIYGAPSDSFKYLISKGQVTVDGYHLNVGATSARFIVQTSGYKSHTVTVSWETGWNNVTCVYDGAYMRTYVNGSAVGTDKAVTGNIVSAPTRALTLGKYSAGATYGEGRQRGHAVWDVALAPGEIADLYETQTLGGPGILGRSITPLFVPSSVAGAGSTISCTAAALTIAGQQATVLQGSTIGCTAAALTVAGQAATVTVSTTISCTAAALTIAGQAATILQGSTISCSAAALTIAGQQATVSSGSTIACTAANLAVAGQQATVTVTATVNCTAATLLLAGIQAAIHQGSTISCSTAALTISGHAASLTSGGVPTVPGVEWTLSAHRTRWTLSPHHTHWTLRG